MKKYLLFFLIISCLLNLHAQKNESQLIIGTWRFDEICDLRTENEKTKSIPAMIPHITPVEITIENGTNHPDRKFSPNNQLEFYYNKDYSSFHYFEIKDNKLFIENRLSKKAEKENPHAVSSLSKRKLLNKKNDGFYYYKAIEYGLIKSVSSDQIEFGTENNYTVWKRIK